MKLVKHSLISVAIASILNPVNIVAEDNWVTVYGKIDVTLDKVDEESGDNQWEVNSNASRFGVKGKGTVAEGIEAFYLLEWQVDVADNPKSNITARNQVVGVRGDLGEVFIGRHDTPMKALQKKIDLFGDKSGDIKHSFNGEKRSDSIVQYTTPKMSGFKLKTAFIPGEETNVNDGLADATSIAVEYSMKNLDLGVALDSDLEGEGIDTSRFIAQYKIDAWQFGFMYQSTDNNGSDGDGIMASAKYSNGDNVYKIQTIDSNSWEAGVSSKVKYASQTSLGWDRKLGKKMTAYTYLTMGEVGVTGDDDSVFGVGLVLKF